MNTRSKNNCKGLEAVPVESRARVPNFEIEREEFVLRDENSDSDEDIRVEKNSKEIEIERDANPQGNNDDEISKILVIMNKFQEMNVKCIEKMTQNFIEVVNAGFNRVKDQVKEGEGSPVSAREPGKKGEVLQGAAGGGTTETDNRSNNYNSGTITEAANWHSIWQQLGGNSITFNPENDHPVGFIKKLKKTFLEAAVPDRIRPMLALKALKGSAHYWSLTVEDSVQNFSEFENSFLNKYWDIDTRRREYNKLNYGSFESGSKANYFLRKVNEFRYILSEISEEEIIEVLANHFPENIREHIHTANYQTVDQVEKYLRKLDNKNDRVRSDVERPSNRNDQATSWRNRDSRQNFSHNSNNYQSQTADRGASNNERRIQRNQMNTVNEISHPQTQIASEMSIEPRGTDNQQMLIECNDNSQNAMCHNENSINTVFNREWDEDEFEEVHPTHSPVKVKSPVVRAEVDKKPVEILIDTGSQISCVSGVFINTLEKSGLKIPKLPTNKMIIAGALKNKTQTVSEQVLLTVRIQNIEIDICFVVVPDLVRSLILGIDWLTKHEAVIDLTHSVLEGNFNEQRLKIQFQHQEICNMNFQITEVIIDDQLENYQSPDAAYTDKQFQEIADQAEVFDVQGRSELCQLLLENKVVFSQKPGLIENYRHEIILRDYKPFFIKSYPIPHAYRESVNKQIKEMLDWGVISRSRTEYVNPLVLVSKKDKTIRVCLDARFLNRRMVNDHVMPFNPNELLLKFTSGMCFSTLDLTAGYWQVEIVPEHRKYTGFLYQGETYVFNVLPFGLSTSVAGFIRALNTVLAEEFSHFVLPYVDDLLIFSKSPSEHLAHLKKLFGRFRKAGITIKLNKCRFAQKEVSFIGHLISPEGIKVDEKRVEAIKAFPPPRNLKALRAFLGFLNYDRRFCPNFSSLVLPLLRLLKKDTKWRWTSAEQEAFLKVKEVFLKAPMLSHPDPNERYYIETDASNYAVASMLYQLEPITGRKKIISFHSRSLRGPEINYAITEKEALAVVTALKQYRVFVINSKLTIISDNKALSFIQTCKLTNSRLSRWILTLQEYNFDIVYRPGKFNTICDILSRNPSDASYGELKRQIIGNEKRYSIDLLEILLTRVGRSVDYSSIRNKLKNIRQSQLVDSYCKNITDKLNGVNPPKRYSEWFVINDGCLFRRGSLTNDGYKLVIPKEWVVDLVKLEHESNGHFGGQKCFAYLSKYYYFPKFGKLIRQITASCLLCQQTKISRHSVGEMCYVLPRTYNELVCADLLGPLPSSKYGMKQLFVMIDAFSKRVSLFPLRSGNRASIINCIKNRYIPRVGQPQMILTDNAKVFSGGKWADALSKLNIKAVHTSNYYPQGNMAERANREIVRLLRMLCSKRHSSWVSHINQIEQWLNQVVHESTGLTPDEVHFSKPRINPFIKLIPFPDPDTAEKAKRDFVTIAYENLKTKAEQRKEKAERNKNLISFEVGDKVMVRTHDLSSATDKLIKKFFALYRGPATVVKKFNNKCYEVVEDSTQVKFGRQNLYNLKKFVAPVNLI